MDPCLTEIDTCRNISVFYKRAAVVTVLHLFRYAQVRILGFIWDPQKYFAIHYFSTCIIIESNHEERCICISSLQVWYGFLLFLGFSYVDSSCSDLCRSLQETHLDFRDEPNISVCGGKCLDCQSQCYMPAMFTSSCQLATTSAQALQQLSSPVIFVSVYDGNK